MTSARRVLVACASLLFLLACEGNGGNIPIEDLRSRAIQAICGQQVRCGRFPDQDTCEGVFFTKLQVFADVQAGKVIYDGRAAADCLGAYESMGCNLTDALPDTPQACSNTFKGTVALGGACFVPDECVSESCNLGACGGTMCCSGACQAKVPLGQDCSSNSSECVPGAFCLRNATGATATCMARIAAGQPCNGLLDCVAGKLCNIDPTTGTGVCGNAPAKGEACPAGFCNASADACDQTTTTCVPRTAVGGACSPPGACVSYARCDAATMKCVAGIAAGGVCATTADCISGLPCENGTCTSLPDEPACP